MGLITLQLGWFGMMLHHAFLVSGGGKGDFLIRHFGAAEITFARVVTRVKVFGNAWRVARGCAGENVAAGKWLHFWCVVGVFEMRGSVSGFLVHVRLVLWCQEKWTRDGARRGGTLVPGVPVWLKRDQIVFFFRLVLGCTFFRWCLRCQVFIGSLHIFQHHHG